MSEHKENQANLMDDSCEMDSDSGSSGIGKCCTGVGVQTKSKYPAPRIDLGEVTPHNIRQLKKLNTVVFPVSYNDKFYKDVLSAGELARLAYYNDVVVGGVCCRVDTSEDQRRLYIMTLGCLAPYRRAGIGTKMLQHVLKFVEEDGNFDSIFLHVQVNNDSAIKFYQKFGFSIVETKPSYYKRIEPADAHVLQKTIKNSSNSQHHHNFHHPQTNSTYTNANNTSPTSSELHNGQHK